MFNIWYWFSHPDSLNIFDILAICVSCAFVLFLSLGGVFVLLDWFHVPTLKISSATSRFVRRQPRANKSGIELALSDLSRAISKKFVRINQYKRKSLLNDLHAAGYQESPEEYVANAIVKSGFLSFAVAFAAVFVTIAICVIVETSSVVPSIIAFFATFVAFFFVLYRSNRNAVKRKLQRKREEIEDELPRFIAIIQQQLQTDKDIIRIFDKFKKTTNESFKEELSIVIADMRTGNYEEALIRMESRINSSLMSDISRGLISTIHGDSMDVFWDNLAAKCAELQKQKLKKKAAKIPRKIDKLSLVIMLSFILIFFYAIGYNAAVSIIELFQQGGL